MQTPDKKTNAAIYEVLIPTHKFPVNRVDTRKLTDYGYVAGDNTGAINAICGWVKSVKAVRMQEMGLDVTGLSIQFCLFSESVGGLRIASDAEMRSANYSGYLRGTVSDGVASIDGLVLLLDGGQVAGSMVQVRRL